MRGSPVHAGMRTLYDEGLSDHAIGRHVGRDASTVGYWRKRAGLPANARSFGNRFSEITDARRRELWNDGLTDAEIGKASGLSQTAVTRWRRAAGLLANGAAGQSERHRRGLALLARGVAPSIVRRLVCVAENTVTRWRRELRASGVIEETRGCKARLSAVLGTGAKRAMAFDLWAAGKLDTEIGRAIGTDRNYVGYWRRTNKLPANAQRGARRRTPAKACRPIGPAITVSSNDLFREALALVPGYVMPDLRSDAATELAMLVLDGTIERADMVDYARTVARRVQVDNLSERAKSLDEEIGEGGFTLGSTLVDAASTEWMGGALERAWQGPLE